MKNIFHRLLIGLSKFKRITGIGERMISVIVPVFRVEKFLDQCVRSIQNQTYKDLEIILVDDGSDDNCPAMCDAYAKEDRRIKVIHKKNGGLSDARNAGLEIATGEYIAFVDSDDYIATDMYEKMAAVMDTMQDVDVVVCPFQKVAEEDCYKKENSQNDVCKHRILEHDGVVREMFLEQYELYIVAWNKLCRRKMWKEVRFPVGKIHEDQYTTYKILYEARKVALMEQPFYFYRQRQGSIMSRFNAKGCMDDIMALQEKMQFFEKKKEWEYACCASRSLEHMIYHYHRAEKYKEKDTANAIRTLFIKDWKQIKKQKIKGISKERTAYFNSFMISDAWMKCYMKCYWKLLGLKRKLRK